MNSLLDLQEMKPTPRNQLIGLLADALTAGRNFADRAKVPAAVPVLGGQGLGSLLLGKAPEELTEISYGNMPLRINPLAGRTASFVPEIKPGRKEQLADLVMAAQAVPGGNRAALAALGAVDTGVGKAMFIGPTAKTWDKAAAATAQKMEKAGADPRAIWSETGTFKGPDGKWRQEISDQGADITDAVFDGIKATQRFEGPMADALTHPSLYQAYPDTGKIGSGFYAWRTPEGTYQATTDTITAGGPGTTSQKSAALHELQHAIQKREGFASGGSPMDKSLGGMQLKAAEQVNMKYRAAEDAIRASEPFKALAAKFEKELPPIKSRLGDGFIPNRMRAVTLAEQQFPELARLQAQRSADVNRILAEPVEMYGYRRLAGEAEARATQSRMNMTPAERRATFPFDSYDVPVNELIVRGLLSP